MSVVPDPEAFNECHLDGNRSYFNNVLLFLQDVYDSGCLVVDKEGVLEDKVAATMNSLPIKYRQRLMVGYEELLKNKRARVVRSLVEAKPSFPRVELGKLLCRIKDLTGADSIAVANGAALAVSAARSFEDLTMLDSYIDSGFREMVRYYRNAFPPIDTLSAAQLESFIVRIVKYAKWLRFYDPQIGKANNTRSFLEGITFIIRLWRKFGHFRDNAEFVEIVTVGEDEFSHGKVVSNLITPLCKEFNVSVQLRLVRDPDRIFHARHLETKAAAVLFDRGFDLFKKSGTRRNIVKLDTPSRGHLKQCLNLPRISAPEE